MKKILVTGAHGQLGSAIRKISDEKSGLDFIFTDSDVLDLTNETAIASFFANNDFQYVINCAAYTAVDKAEGEIRLCTKINRDAVGLLSKACAGKGVKLIHISTDYVFDGKNYKPYTEDDATLPQSVYGQTKLDGENLALQNNRDTVIIRTSWLYSEFGNNFVKTMIRLGKEREWLNVVSDQIGTPTYASDLAEAILAIVLSVDFTPGVYHFSNEGACSWYDFTKVIHRMTNIHCDVHPIDSTDYPTPAKRPYYSVLNKKKIKETYGLHIPYWEDSLTKCIEIIENKNI